MLVLWCFACGFRVDADASSRVACSCLCRVGVVRVDADASSRVACSCLCRVGVVRVDADAKGGSGSGCGVPGFCRQCGRVLLR